MNAPELPSSFDEKDTRPWLQRHKGVAIWGGLAIAGLVFMVAVIAWPDAPPPPPPPPVATPAPTPTPTPLPPLAMAPAVADRFGEYGIIHFVYEYQVCFGMAFINDAHTETAMREWGVIENEVLTDLPLAVANLQAAYHETGDCFDDPQYSRKPGRGAWFHQWERATGPMIGAPTPAAEATDGP